MQRLNLIIVRAMLSSLMLGFWLVPSGTVAASPMMVQVAETTFIGSTVLVIDQPARQLTVRTAEGKVLTLPVADVALLAGLTKGDRVSFEIDTKERIITLVKVTGSGSGSQSADTERGG